MSLFRPKEYLRPSSIKETTNLLKKYGKSAAVLAGGTDLLVVKPPQIKYIVDISRLPLSYVESNGRGIRIGAMTTVAELETSQKIKKESYNVLSRAAFEMGTPITKNISTIGGNICNAAPSADMAPPLIVLDAVATIVGTSGKRKVSVEEFFTGPKKCCLNKDELLTEIFVPRAPKKTKATFMKKGRTSEDISQVNAAVRITLGAGGICKEVRIALGAVAPTPIRAKEAEAMVQGRKIKDISEVSLEVAQTASEAIKPISDIRASAEYRREVAKVLVKRTLADVVGKFKVGK